MDEHLKRRPDDQTVERALATLGRVDRPTAEAARAAYAAVNAGEGLQAVTGHDLADFLWYQLPTKWFCPLEEKLFLAAALGQLLTRLDLPRYAAMCTAESTAQIITVYERDGYPAGIKAYQKALAGSGLQPADLPDQLCWGTAMGLEEATAYRLASAALDAAIDAGRLRPGASGWRRTAAQITAEFLHTAHDQVTGSNWLQWIHTERLQRFADSRGPVRARLAAPLADRLVNPVALPDDAEQVLAPLRWLLDHAATGAPLTATGNLARPLVAEGCRLFDWLTLTGNPRSESDIVELWTLRDWAKQMGLVRRSGRRLLLSTTGKAVHAGGTPALWQATMPALLGPSDAEAAAGEIALMLLTTHGPLQDRELENAVAEALAGEGWRGQSTDQPVTTDQAAKLLRELRRRLRLLGLTKRHRFDEPTQLTETGHAAAHTALRARALRPRSHPLD